MNCTCTAWGFCLLIASLSLAPASSSTSTSSSLHPVSAALPFSLPGGVGLCAFSPGLTCGRQTQCGNPRKLLMWFHSHSMTLMTGWNLRGVEGGVGTYFLQMSLILVCCRLHQRFKNEMHVWTHHFLLNFPHKLAEVATRISLFVSECCEEGPSNREQEALSLS